MTQTGVADELRRRGDALQRTAQEYIQVINMLDGKYENKENEIKALELRIDKLKEEAMAIATRSNEVLQGATEEAANIRSEAGKLLDEAKTAKARIDSDFQKAQSMTKEAQALFAQAAERQKTADDQWLVIQQRQKKFEEALK